MEHTPMGGPKPKLTGDFSNHNPHTAQLKKTGMNAHLVPNFSGQGNIKVNNNNNSSSNVATSGAVKWGYGIKGNTRVIFDEHDSAIIEQHFQSMKTNLKPDHPHRIELTPSSGGEMLILDFFQMRVTKDRDSNYNLCLSRILPEHSFVPYKVPKNPKDEYLDNPFGVKEDKLIAQWVRWDGSDAAFQSYDNLLWSAYSVHESNIIEDAYKRYLNDTAQTALGRQDEVKSTYPIDTLYCVNFKNYSQFRSNNPQKRRRIRRMLYRWFWEDNNQNWMAYTKEQSVEIEQALLSNSPDVTISINGESYVVNFLEMCQYHSSNQLKRRALHRVGPKIERKVIFIGDPNLKGEKLLIHTSTSFPQYWTLPCDDYSISRISIDNKLAIVGINNLGKQISKYFYETGQHDFELINISLIQAPMKCEFDKERLVTAFVNDVRGSFVHKKGKMISKSVVDQISSSDKVYLAQNPIGAPLLDSHVNELYLWHGNTHQCISGMASNKQEIGIALRTAILSGAGGFYFSDKVSIANTYSTCTVCNSGGYGAYNNQCLCEPHNQVFYLLLSRVLLGKIQCLFHYNHDEFNRLTKSPLSSSQGEIADAILGVGGSDGFREIIINDESQIYPEFLVSYRRTKIANLISIPSPNMPHTRDEWVISEKEREAKEKETMWNKTTNLVGSKKKKASTVSDAQPSSPKDSYPDILDDEANREIEQMQKILPLSLTINKSTLDDADSYSEVQLSERTNRDNEAQKDGLIVDPDKATGKKGKFGWFGK